jgi:hypothetical protein
MIGAATGGLEMATEMLETLREAPQAELRRQLFDAEANVRLLRAVLRERDKLDRERVSYEQWLRQREEELQAAGSE